MNTPRVEASSRPAVAGLPLRILRAEGVVLFAAALTAFFGAFDEPWWLVPLLLLVPDVFMVGYARSSRVGAMLYNFAHSYPAPTVLGVVALIGDQPLWQAVALIWFAHIGMDRAAGYGLKYDTHFKDTHLGRIGRGDQLIGDGVVVGRPERGHLVRGRRQQEDPPPARAAAVSTSTKKDTS